MPSRRFDGVDGDMASLVTSNEEGPRPVWMVAHVAPKSVLI